MPQGFPDIVNRHSGSVQVACIGFPHFVGALCSLPLTLRIFFQHIGDLPGGDPLPIPHKDIFAGMVDLLQDVNGLRNQRYKTIAVCFGVLYDLILVRYLIPGFLTDNVKVLYIAVIRPF